MVGAHRKKMMATHTSPWSKRLKSSLPEVKLISSTLATCVNG